MSWIEIKGIGLVHLNLDRVKVVPGYERHKWDCKPSWGGKAVCLKCRCTLFMLKCEPHWVKRFQPFGTSDMLVQRPPCTANPPIKFNPGK